VNVIDAPETIATDYGRGNTHWLIPMQIVVEWTDGLRPNAVTVRGPLMLKGGKPSERQMTRARFYLREAVLFHDQRAPDWVFDVLTEVGVL